MSNYDDIIHLPHHVSPTHKPMSKYQRAAQFAPFAALTGHKEAVEQTARDVADMYDQPADEAFFAEPAEAE